MVNVTERQLRAWEAQGLVKPGASFGFSDILALKTLRKLRELKIAPARIRQAVASLKSKLDHIDYPLAQLRITAEGKRLTVHLGGTRMEPITGQLLLDFDSNEIEKLRSFPVKTAESRPIAPGQEQVSEHWFQRGLALEESGAPVEDAVAAYRRAIESNPNAPGALVNLGTIAFRSRKMKEATAWYTRALEADPEYPLAHFNLGNLYDEQGTLIDARKHYVEAIRLNPRYADAYFNLALLCERTGDLLQAIGYWNTYLKLDATSSWASAARKQLDRLKKSLRSK
jgi:tetratricopeptide (TPR) repeat protein